MKVLSRRETRIKKETTTRREKKLQFFSTFSMFLSKQEDQLAQELSCPICLQLYNDPVVLPCGHNYCRACISKSADSIDSGKEPLRCPECREAYHGVDTLQKNFKLSNIVEGFQASSQNIYEEIQDVIKPTNPDADDVIFCDQCIDDKTPAVKTCLKCEVSLCFRHLQKHNERESFKTHSLVEPLKDLGSRACPVHNLPLEYFCSNDMRSLCITCLEGHDQNHDVLTFSVAEEEMRRALESRSKVVSSRLQLTECLLQKTQEDQGASEAVGDKMVNKAVSLMDSMAAIVDRFRERLRLLLEEERGQRRKSWQLGVSALEEQQQQLQEAQKSASEALSETDTCAFIHRFMMIEQKLRDAATGSLPSTIPSKVDLNTKRLQTDLKTNDFRTEIVRLLDTLHILLNPLEVTFNVCTAHPSLLVSNDLHTVRCTSSKQSYVEHPERFLSAPQILCSQGFSRGTHIWVAEMGSNCMWSLGACYKSIPRRGDHSRLGHNLVSWRLQWKNGKLTACSSSSNAMLGEVFQYPSKIEVVLDCEGGTLSFHTIKSRREHLYTFKTVFKEPVYPAFSIHSNTSESWITLHSQM
ncbi:PREDICTED: E3 ubiquitin/ISG15 ligase TRIM25-like [Poecilia mexicana]|uniref:E3 ubiquitin/ISG15 ligase TRIM25-like n=1 Tax=Poecilia mexicana TaxID=48701 RepID=UPI00072E8820|nr:PREDICTED: E3 ubiquitin/ISG15 ligase TRIM25-like [Poecilia mexicana]